MTEAAELSASLDALSDHELAVLAGAAHGELRRREEGRTDLIPIWYRESQPGLAAAVQALTETKASRERSQRRPHIVR